MCACVSMNVHKCVYVYVHVYVCVFNVFECMCG